MYGSIGKSKGLGKEKFVQLEEVVAESSISSQENSNSTAATPEAE